MSFVSVAGLLIVVTVSQLRASKSTHYMSTQLRGTRNALRFELQTRTLKRWKRKRQGRALAEDAPLEPVAFLFILAMCMELIQSFANILSVRWAFQGATTKGHYCTAQAVLKQLGNDGAALFTMFLAIMTVVPTIWPSALRRDQNRKIVLCMIGFVVVFWLLMITIPATVIKSPDRPYYGSTGYVMSNFRTAGSYRFNPARP